MEQNMNKKPYAMITKFVNRFLKYTIVALKVLIIILFLGLIAVVAIPKSNFEFDLANIKNININYMHIIYQFNNNLFTGVVNVKWSLFLILIIGMVNLVFFTYIISQLRYILNDVENRIPFSKNNITRLKYMGLAYLLAGVILPSINSALLLHFVNLIGVSAGNSYFSLNFQSIFMGVIILILAYVFEYGSFLQEEHDMTV